ncbi:RNA polymerase factor sigma-54 [Mangrovibacterium diazotrophicum]|uniref:RNA polymerase RpoN-/SigL-like sigma 54 subunit n=1 Tax=Mangrovibacterium diazotrophicum TaxID=1261403 RepID=A0A419WA64_9BACT|nr:RNA polymerase factor sigma-54 [Mangrovibacterium diazotrophicum]RKD92358.1 RNA polymerase RpoN-/SigL-like sigma 54 subunit [Mangrovibacterium diazotrophicum]
MPSQKLSLQQKLLQKLSPQQIQVIKLLEIPTVQLEQRIKKELEENPVLEMLNDTPDEESNMADDDSSSDSDGDEFSLEDYMDEDDIPEYKLAANNYSKDDKQIDVPFSAGTSFHESMHEQLGLADLDEDKRKLAEYIIGNIDDDGYLRRDLLSISDDLAFNLNLNVSEKELEELLEVIQEFDPAGVGARDLRECLLLQIQRRRATPASMLAEKIISENFDEFTKKHYDKILRKYDASEDELKDAIAEILKLNPKPGGSYSNPLTKSNQVIVPDFILENQDGELQLSLNQRNVPDLRMNGHYMDMLKSYSENRKNISRDQKDAMMFVKQKLDSAKWFIDAIRQRHQTLLVTMSEIIDFQKDYFQDGDETKLKPMILKDIADRTGLDISTISRVSNSKYIQTNFGIFPLKYFFSEGMQKDTGEEVSTREIKKILEDCISGEDKRRPLTDDRLAQILKEKSYPIARRTVAKYREQLGIPVARMRKEL